MKMSIPPASQSSVDNERIGRAQLDCNLTSLCDHIQMEGFNSGVFSDIVVHAMTSNYHLHRLILSRSSYFRNMLHGPWKEANAPIVTLHIDDDNVNGEAIAIALAYLYGHRPKLNDSNAFRVLAAASFLDLQDLCAICTDFIISELWTSNFLSYQVFAESQDYGIHGERVRSACWGYLCQSGAMELKEVLPKLSSPTLHALLTSDELWVPSEEKRFELALDTLLAKGALLNIEFPETGGNANLEMATGVCSDSHVLKGDNLVNNNTNRQIIEGYLSLKDGREGHKTAHNILVELAESVVDFHIGLSDSKPQKLEARYPCKVEQSALSESSFANQDGIRSSCSYNETQNSVEANRMSDVGGVAMEGPSEGNSCYNLNNSIWLPREQSRLPNEWGKCGTPPSWGGRTVGRRQVKNCAIRNCGVHREEYDSFINIFEGGSVLYCNMSFESLLSVRRQLEELGFPCKAVNDGLWLQTLLNHRVQEVAADTCKNCCLTSSACVCRQSYGFSQGVGTTGYYVQEHDRNNPSGNMGNIYVSETAPQSEVNGYSRPVRVHVRGPIDGLAGIGRGTTLVQANAWPPTRFVFSRVPFGLGNRNCQLSLGNDDSEARVDLNGESSGDGLTALVELSQGGRNGVYGEQERGFDPDSQTRFTGAAVAGPSTCGVAVQMLEAQEQATELEWQNTDSSSINLDMKTPLFDFPPFRFGVEFEGVHRLYDAHVKHSPEVFYAGSFWKISIQAFNDEDPQGRRTLGLFLHRRKAEITDPLRKVHMCVDCREKVTARYELICPSKREITVFGRDKEEKGTLLPKAPKGWGWRTALYFDELSDLLQGGALRVAAVVQLV